MGNTIELELFHYKVKSFFLTFNKMHVERRSKIAEAIQVYNFKINHNVKNMYSLYVFLLLKKIIYLSVGRRYGL